MKKMKWILGVVVLSLLATANTFAQDKNLLNGWTQLGSRVVDYSLDHDVVSLNNSKEVFTQLRVSVTGGALNMHKATVHFANGDKQDIDFPEVVSSENDGKVLDLAGNNRVIEKVTFWYDTKANSSQKATITVFGKKS